MSRQGAVVPELRAVPLLPSLDLDETEAFYAVLGFQPVARSLATLTLRRDETELEFWLTANRRIPQSSCCSLYSTGVVALLASLPPGVTEVRGRLSRGLASAETVIQDCHGNELYLRQVGEGGSKDPNLPAA